MGTITENHPTFAPDPEAIAIHVLHTMTTRQRAGRRTNLDDLVEALEVRRADVRRVVSALHRQGFVDVERMRLTLMGFAVGSSVRSRDLRPLRRRVLVPVSSSRAA